MQTLTVSGCLLTSLSLRLSHFCNNRALISRVLHSSRQRNAAIACQIKRISALPIQSHWERDMSQILKTLAAVGSTVWLSFLAVAPFPSAHDKLAFRATGKALERIRRRARQDNAGTKPKIAQPTKPVSVPAQPMPSAKHWTKVSAVIEGAAQSSRMVCDLQSAATQQLELAEYALDRLMDELSAVMTPRRTALPALARA
jgi:hypothetical protein